ncbi:DUF418 domain-containing protein [Streptomyces sp. NPDC053755]|uniref:DUF418 domain-containing protein n=1 Tax=Streptomyces sp. NPDC053755 TaxID=3155815 RepID=UPI00343DDA32
MAREATDAVTLPAEGGRRIQEVDALRGFALGGILVVNALVIAGVPAVPGDTADLVAKGLVTAFVETKFYLLFSFLFGYSFTLQQESAERAGARFVPRMLRRLLGLFVLGLLHFVLLYTGDILTMYAVLGLILLAARGASAGRLWTAARWVHAATSALLLAAAALLTLLTGDGADGAPDTSAQTARLTEAYRGAPADVIAAHLSAWSEVVGAFLFAGGLITAALLAGAAAGRRRLLAGETLGTDRLRRIGVYGVVCGLPGSLLMAAGATGVLPYRWETLTFVVGMVTAPALTAAYGSALLLWMRTPRGAATRRLLAPAGRMALTGYLTQSLVLALVFTGYGLALYGRVGAVAVLGGALVLYAGQLLLSAWLMRRHRLGPVEWLLRAVTLAGHPDQGRRTRS